VKGQRLKIWQAFVVARHDHRKSPATAIKSDLARFDGHNSSDRKRPQYLPRTEGLSADVADSNRLDLSGYPLATKT
jgi:hypothetical protein